MLCTVGLLLGCAGSGSKKQPDLPEPDATRSVDTIVPVDTVNPLDAAFPDLTHPDGGSTELDIQSLDVEVIVPDEVTPGCPPGTPCDDDDPCTVDDQCHEDGGCLGTALDCTDDNPCTEDSCTTEAGCKNVPVVTTCDDGDPCTTDDLCLDGQCEAGPGLLDCDDSNPCTDDSCLKDVGCQHENNEGPCDDGNACTEGDLCSAGACAPGPNTCGCLNQDDCDEIEDGNLCNGTFYCDTTANPPACVIDVETIVECQDPPPNKCLAWSCKPATGTCITVPAAEGEGCDDEDDCTTADICTAGSCEGAYIPACGVGEPCENWDDCVNGLTCFAAMPGGYCTMLNCKVADCPAGSKCSPINNGNLQVCMTTCSGNQDCREEDGHGCTAGGGCWCGEEICQAGDPFCIGDVKGTCNTCGSALEPDAVDCSTSDQFCYLGACVDCVPQCEGKECGPDSCESLCGICQNQDVCLQETGSCCTPDCLDKECGPNGCGGLCGLCADETICLPAGTCCTPDCLDKECGADGCTGTCGTCEAPAACADGLCIVPDPG